MVGREWGDETCAAVYRPHPALTFESITSDVSLSLPSFGFRLNAVKTLLLRFAGARRGNVAIIFALTLVPMVCLIGGAIDLSIGLSNKSQMQDAADAASLAAATAANNYLLQNGTGTTAQAAAIALANATAQNVFTANFVPAGGVSTPTVTPTTSINSSAPTVSLTVSGVYTPVLLPIIGVKTVGMTTSSTSTMTPNNAYFQIIFVVDVSGSMAIGGDPGTIASMTSEGAFLNNGVECAFACHDPTNQEQFTATDYCNSNPSDSNCESIGATYCPKHTHCNTVYSASFTDKRNLARLYGYSLKIDYVNSAISNFMTQLTTYSTKYPGRFTVGIDTFGSNADGNGNYFYMLLPPTTNMTTAAASASTIDIEGVLTQAQNWGYTYTTSGLTSALSHLTNYGNGSSTTKMRTYVVFLSDGIEDVPGNSQWGRMTDLSYGSACTALKNAGINVFSIWAPYYTVPSDAQYNTLVAPLSGQTPGAMQACASSSSQYFSATNGAQITAAVNSTFNTIINNSNLRLSQ